MVRRENTEAMSFYHHLGYDDQDCVVLGRRLDGTGDGSNAGSGP